ncbi:hypothetical protein ACWPKO_25995 (plasmid) [Coraliomargarita sp. W4R53]
MAAPLLGIGRSRLSVEPGGDKMARVGGRNAWIAVPVGLICAAIVGALVWLAIPMTPVLAVWGGDMLRQATTVKPLAEVGISPAELALAEGDLDCRELYPDDLWAEMVWQGGAVLSQTPATQATEVVELVAAVQPQLRATCAWQLHADRSVVTTLSHVEDDAIILADASLRSQGFSCTSDGAALTCTRTRGDVIETQVLREGLWLSSLETNWHPSEYGSRLSAFVWG